MSPSAASLARTARARVAGAAGQATLMSGLLAGFQGLAGILTAGWLGDHDRGIVVLATSTSSLLLLVAGLGLNNVARMLMADPNDGIDIRVFQRGVAKIVAVEALPLAVTAVVAFALLSRVRDPLLLGLFAVHCIAMTYGAIVRESLHGMGRHRVAIGTDLAAAVILFLGATIAHLTGHLSVLVMICLMLAGSLSQSLIGFFVGRRVGPVGRSRVLDAKDLVRLALPGIGLTLGQWVAWRSDRMILGAVAGPGPVGVYGFVSTLVDVPWIIPGATSAVLTRRVGQGATNAQIAGLRRRTVRLTFLATLVMAAIAIPLIPIFPGGEYPSGIPALLILVPASLGLASAQMDLSACVGFGDLRASAKATIASGITAVALTIPLAWWLGPTGCAIASLVAYTVMAIQARAALRPHLARNAERHPDVEGSTP